MYHVVIVRQAKKSLRKLPQKYQLKIRNVLAILKFEPFIGKKLEGRYKDKYSISVWPYRIIYKIKKKELIVEVVEISPRGGMYRK